jgi:hypothetical protein
MASARRTNVPSRSVVLEGFGRIATAAFNEVADVEITNAIVKTRKMMR